MQELEQKLATYQAMARRRDIEHRLALQKMEAENRHLRTLLHSLGISTDLLRRYVELADQGSAADKKVAIPAIYQQKKTSIITPAQETQGSDHFNTVTREILQDISSEDMRADAPQGEAANSAEKKQQYNDPHLCKCLPGQRDLASGPVDGDVLNTTLCAIAEELIEQYNTRGTDLEEIRQRLWSGFQSGVAGDGCRVQNNVLFQVLDDISHNV